MENKPEIKKIQMKNERFHLRSPNINVCFKVEIMGSIDENAFVHAVDSVCKRHPILKSTVSVDHENDAWFLLDNGSVGVEFYDACDNMDWLKWYEKTDNMPFDFLNGPLVKIGVIRKLEYIDMVILGHHILGDGIGYLNLTKDILASLNGNLSETPQIPYIENNFRKKTKLDILSKSYAKKLNKTWADSRVTFSESYYRTFFKEYRKEYPPGMFLASLEGKNFAELLSVCKKNRITVNEAIATAFIAALQKMEGRYNEKPIRLGTAASIRNELTMPALDCMGNYVTGISTEVRYDFSKGFSDNARYISGKLREKLNNPKSRYLVLNFLNVLDKDFIESAIYAAYGNYDSPVSKKLGELIGEQIDNKGIGISNLGKQIIKEYDVFKISDVLFIPPAFPANLINIGVMTVDERLNFCLRYAKSEISENVIEQIYLMVFDVLTGKPEKHLL